MPLITQLKHDIEAEDSMFRAQLMREDVARLEKLRTMASCTDDPAQFLKEGAYIGWTQSDMHTHKIKDALETFLGAFYDYEHGSQDDAAQGALRAAWDAFCAERMEKLIRCL